MSKCLIQCIHSCIRSKRTRTVKYLYQRSIQIMEWRREIQYHLYADDVQMCGTLILPPPPTKLASPSSPVFSFYPSWQLTPPATLLLKPRSLEHICLLSPHATSSSSIPSTELHLSLDHFTTLSVQFLITFVVVVLKRLVILN